MFKRILILLIAMFSIAASWIISISVLIILIFKQRHPDHCMAEYYNKVAPGEMVWKCPED